MLQGFQAKLKAEESKEYQFVDNYIYTEDFFGPRKNIKEGVQTQAEEAQEDPS